MLQQAFFSPLTFPVESLVQQLFAFPVVHLSQHCLSAVQSPLHLSQQDDALAQQAFSSPTLHLSQHLFAVVHSFVHLSQQGVSLQQLAFSHFSPSLHFLLWQDVNPINVTIITIMTVTIDFVFFILFLFIFLIDKNSKPTVHVCSSYRSKHLIGIKKRAKWCS